MNMKREIAVFISSGIGNAILLVPALKLLSKNSNYKVVIILTSPFVSPEFLFSNSFPSDEIIDLRNKNFILFGLQNRKRFEKAYLDYSSSSVKNILFATLISKEVFAYRKNKIFSNRIKYFPLIKNMHAAVLHARMINPDMETIDFSLDLMKLDIVEKSNRIIEDIKNTGQKIVSVQVSSGNNKTPYKNWPIEHWIAFLKKLIIFYPEFTIVLLGDENEVESGKKIKSEIQNNKLLNLIGKTGLVDASIILNNSDLYIGLDSAFMHLAVAYGIPTFTILGASSEKFIGYDQFDKLKHCVVYKNLSCRPCHAWPYVNTTKTKNPLNCPDFECLKELKPEFVFDKFKEYLGILK